MILSLPSIYKEQKKRLKQKKTVAYYLNFLEKFILKKVKKDLKKKKLKRIN